MRVLAFDCAGAQCAAALLDGSAMIGNARIDADRGHAQFLMPLLVDLVTGAGLTFGEIDRFAVTTGPGSFTGIRVALAAATGLHLGTGKPVIGIPVFDVVAAAARDVGFAQSRLLVAIESRRDECFVQLFNAAAAPLGAPEMLTPEDIGAWAGPAPVAVTGDATPRVLGRLEGAVAVGGATNAVEPAILARIAAASLPGASMPKPFYFRRPDVTPAVART